MKNRCKSVEEAKAEHLPFIAAVFSTPEGVNQAILVGGSNNTGVWGRSPQPLKANRGSGAELPTLRRFYKKYAF